MSDRELFLKDPNSGARSRGCRLARGIAPVLVAAACAACSSAAGTSSDAGPTDGGHGDTGAPDAGATDVESTDTQTDAANSAACGFVMPNPASVGLPHPASYHDNGDGTVTDLVTGLIWDHDASAMMLARADAVAYCATRAPKWRLPTRIELVSLVDFTVPNPGPTINGAAFPNTPGTVFWTSSPNLSNPMSAWSVSFDIGYSDYDDVSDQGHARCVSVPAEAMHCFPQRYMAAAAGEIMDLATQLTWQQPPAPQPRAWADAKTYCAGLGGSWRLPSMTELQTLVDDRQSPATIDPQAFPNTPAGVFWTSSPVAADIYAWAVDFSSGNTTNPDLSAANQVRCVH